MALHDSLKTVYGNKFEFVRGDHYYSYYNEYNKLPFNLNMLASTKITSSDSTGNNENAADGTPATMWASSAPGTKYLQFAFDRTYSVSRYVLRLAETNGLANTLNIKKWKVEVSRNGTSWTLADEFTTNTAAVVDKKIPPKDAKFIRITFTDTGGDSTARIADVEIYGAVK